MMISLQKYRFGRGLVILTLMAMCRLFGQSPVLRFTHIGPEQGLSHKTVTSAMQDGSGFMWFGTVDGLNRFDGYRCKVFKHDPNDPTSLSSSFIHGFLEDREGGLWIATRDAGLSILTQAGRKNDAFQRISHDPNDPDSLSSNRIHSLYRDRSGRIWVGTDKSLDLYEPETRRFRHFRVFRHEPIPISVSGMLEDASGTLWLTTFNGLYGFDLNHFEAIDPENCSDRLIHYPHDPKDPNSPGVNQLSGLFLDREGRIWLSTRGGGIILFDRERAVFRSFRHEPGAPNGLSKNNASLTFQDERGFLWIGTDGGGLNILDPETGRFTQYRHQPSRSDSISHDNVTRVYRSSDGEDGTIWVCTWGGGVDKLITDKKPFNHAQHDPDNRNSLSGNFVFALCEDRFGGLWVGANGAGLNHWDRSTDVWRRFLPDPDEPGGIGDLSIWFIVEDRGGDLWVGTEHGGLHQLKRSRASDPIRFIRHRAAPDQPNGLLENNVRTLYEDRSGALWLGYEDLGLSRLDPDQREGRRWVHYRHDPDNPNSLSDNTVRCFYQDAEGMLWIGTYFGGLNRLEIATGAFTRFQHEPDDVRSLGNNDVRAILETRDGRLWIGTYGAGLNLLDRASGAFRAFTEIDGLANNFIYGLLEDDQGHLWLSTNRGLSQFDLKTEVFTNYGTQHGLQSDEFNTGAYFKSKSGEFFFGGVNGFNYFKPETLLETFRIKSGYKPPVVLTDFIIMGASVSLGAASTDQNTLTLAHDDKYFSFEMAVLDFHNPAKNRFQYKLEGFDEDWLDNENRHYASYTNLDPGDYQLRYRGANDAGVWNEGPPVSIRITPPFWRTWWFRALMLGVLVVAFFSANQIKKYYQAYRGVKFVGHFKLLKKLGEGGSGVVFQARDKLSKQIVALKVLNSRMEETRDGIRRFLQEAEIGSRLDHPHIVKIHEAGSHGKTRFISMEYIKGQTLKQYIQDKSRLEETEIYELAAQVLDGLGAIHDREIVHRDLKSANIMVLEDRRIKIMDFGLARLSTLTTIANRDQLMGTLSYMSPEQTLGKVVDLRGDIYSFGVVLYEMWFGKLPFSAQNEMEMIYAIHNEKPPDLEDAASPLVPIIAQCLEKDPAARYADVEALKNALAGIKQKPLVAAAEIKA